MSSLLFLAHRLPFPPNKGDKVRSYHLLKHLSRSHRIFLGAFYDDPDDERHVDALRSMCADIFVCQLQPKRARLRSLNGLFIGEPMTLPYFRDARMAGWVDAVCRDNLIDKAVISSSAMGQYVTRMRRLPIIVDLVDVDSAKWRAFSKFRKWPYSWLLRREGEYLLAYERSLAARADRTFLVTENEVRLFRELAPECGIRVEAMKNGVDCDYFSPSLILENPFPDDVVPLVFTGELDYWPNVDAVLWFVKEILPELLVRHPKVRFYAVGRNPSPEVKALEAENVVITGTVPDVRPYLSHASVIVAPVRIARGIQNKVLEALAMSRPVVTLQECADNVGGESSKSLKVASGAADFVDLVSSLIADPGLSHDLGRRGRDVVLQEFDWDTNLSAIDQYLSAGPAMRSGAQ